MILRAAFFALMALGLMGFGTVAWLSMRQPAPATAAPVAAPAVTRKVMLVAARPVQVGNLLKPDDLAAKELPLDGLPQDAIDDTLDMRAAVIGSMVRRPLATGEALRSSSILKPGEHGFLAAVLAAGMRGITIGVDAASGSHGLIWPGDRVDVILTQTIGDAAVPIGRRVAAETVLHNTRVIAIDQHLLQGSAPAPGDPHGRTVTLEVSPEQVERLSVAMRLGRLSLSLRPAAELANERERGARPVWARDVSPALGLDGQPAGESVIRIFQGAGATKEFKF